MVGETEGEGDGEEDCSVLLSSAGSSLDEADEEEVEGSIKSSGLPEFG
jgi:hypothetical protein